MFISYIHNTYTRHSTTATTNHWICIEVGNWLIQKNTTIIYLYISTEEKTQYSLADYPEVYYFQSTLGYQTKSIHQINMHTQVNGPPYIHQIHITYKNSNHQKNTETNSAERVGNGPPFSPSKKSFQKRDRCMSCNHGKGI